MTLEVPIPQSETGVFERECTLAGTRALVTGASRDIGAAISIALAREGVDVIGIYREKAKRAILVQNKVDEFGGKLSFVQADITTEQGISDIDTKLGENRLDFLILNASGATRDVNISAAQNLIDGSLDRMREGGTIILMQSVPGHFAEQLEDSPDQPDFYKPIARAKREGEVEIRKRIGELEEKGIKVIVVCPPVVPDTSNMRIFKGIDKEAADKHKAITDKLGLPDEVSREEVGQKIVELLLHKNEYPSGYTEFFNGTRDSRSLLGKWYDEPRIYVDTAKRIIDRETAREGIARLIVSREQAERAGEPKKFLDGTKNDEMGFLYGTFIPRPEHAQGHFKTESELPLLYPGHKQIRTSFEYAVKLTQMLPDLGNQPFKLQSVNGIEFKRPILANGSSEMRIYACDHEARKDGTHSFKIEIKDTDSKIISTVTEMVLAPEDELSEELLPDQLIEGMAQAAGSVGLDFDPEKFPLFGGISDINFAPNMPQKGDGIQYIVSVVPQGKRGFDKFKAQIAVLSGDGALIAYAEGIQATLFPKSMITKFLK